MQIERGKTVAGYIFYNHPRTAQVVGVVASISSVDLSLVGNYGLKGFIFPRESGVIVKLLSKDFQTAQNIIKDLGLNPEGLIEL